MAKGALLYVFDLKYHLDIEYTYLVPEHITNIVRGCFTVVPFGRGNRKVIALCKELTEVNETEGLKYIISTVSENFTLSEEMMKTVEYLKENTFCNTSDAVRRIIPCDSLNKATEYYITVDCDISSLSGKMLDIRNYVKSNEPVEISSISADIFGSGVRSYLNRLEEGHFIKRELVLKEQIKDAKELFAYINGDISIDDLMTKRSPEQYREIYSRIKSSGLIPVQELQSEGFSRAHIRAMEKRGFIKFEEHEKLRIPYSDYVPEVKEYILSPEQNEAYLKLKELADSGKSKGALLYGITGSGKSSVILQLCKYITSIGKTAIIMVPEIALTWQSVEMYMQYYGRRLQVINSSLSDGERFDAYKRIKRGEVSVVLGTRSAIFAPLENLGLIVIDEEQEHTYKSDISPKYLTHDVARLRCKINNSLMVLSSATPSVETYYRAKCLGIYSLIKLNNRYGDAKLPETVISDMRKDGRTKIIGKTLEENLKTNYESFKQSMLLLNRRGYSSSVVCHVCGETIMCPNCSVATTVHRTRNGDVLMCHCCGYSRPMVKICPSCKSEHISALGYGTQAVEEEVKKILPNAKILRMDADTVTKKNARDEIVSSFAKGECDVLIGTQMIAKGHNFPYVTLAACINIDSSLYSNDFKASERTFDLLTQLEGRSGRSKHKGIALIQTFNPMSEIISLSKKQDYEAFFEKEIKQRKAFVFPPFCDIAVITFSSENETLLSEVAVDCHNKLNEILATSHAPMQIFGPFECPIYKLKNRYRKRIVIKHMFNSDSRNVFRQLMLYESEKNTDVSVSIDINPNQT